MCKRSPHNFIVESPRKKSFLEHYKAHFGDAKFQFIDLTPEYDKDLRPCDHISLEDRFTFRPPTDEEIAAMDEYRHPCWCNPELIYADDLKGNEVWLHKPVQ